jgi:hypothetical protein
MSHATTKTHDSSPAPARSKITRGAAWVRSESQPRGTRRALIRSRGRGFARGVASSRMTGTRATQCASRVASTASSENAPNTGWLNEPPCARTPTLAHPSSPREHASREAARDRPIRRPSCTLQDRPIRRPSCTLHVKQHGTDRSGDLHARFHVKQHGTDRSGDLHARST